MARAIVAGLRVQGVQGLRWTTPPAIDWLRAWPRRPPTLRRTRRGCGGHVLHGRVRAGHGHRAGEMLAPVLSQPSLPIGPGARKAALGLSDQDLLTVKARAEDDDLCVLGLRFTGDRMVPAERFATLRRELGDRFVGVEDRLVARQPVGAPQPGALRADRGPGGRAGTAHPRRPGAGPGPVPGSVADHRLSGVPSRADPHGAGPSGPATGGPCERGRPPGRPEPRPVRGRHPR